jgi:hypothetical protein
MNNKKKNAVFTILLTVSVIALILLQFAIANTNATKWTTNIIWLICCLWNVSYIIYFASDQHHD